MISLILITIAGILNAIMDVLAVRYDVSVFSKLTQFKLFLDPRISWANKYKNGSVFSGPKFFGSTTFFVSFTDAWHLAKSLMIWLIAAAIIFYKPIVNPLIDIFIMHILFSVAFELFFGTLFIKGALKRKWLKLKEKKKK